MPSAHRFQDSVALEVRKDVELDGAGYIALSEEPWLGFPAAGKFPQNGFVKLVYATRLSDPAVRPLLRFRLGPEKAQDHILPAPTEGVGIWIGRAPPDGADVWISPTNRRGRFDFRVLDVRAAGASEVAQRVVHSPVRLFFALSAGLVGLAAESQLNWKWALGQEPLERYSNWRRSRRSKAPALPCLEGPDRAPILFYLVLNVDRASPSMIDATCESIERQSYDAWRVRFTGAPADEAAQRRSAWEQKPRFRFERDEPLNARGVVGELRAGDELSVEALACFARHFLRHPEHDVAYSDDVLIDSAGTQRRIWKPGWSPTLQRSMNYIGGSAFLRAHLLPKTNDWTTSLTDVIDRAALDANLGRVGSIPRALFKLRASSRPAVRSFSPVFTGEARSVSVVIPTRDRPDLLRDCLESLFEKTSYQNYDVVLVDNDSVDARTHELFGRLQASHERLKILKAPGDFNFSALSNAGAAASAGEFLVFLNNDTRVVTPDWIERLLYFAVQPDVGAIGAKLLYPNGKTQHVGVLLGMGGVAGHFGAGLDERAPGWMGRNLVPHEVSAVTGACLMVERRKFEAVGRFDEENLPVDLNDVDLCLRLRKQGWRTICNSQVVLVHRQSASRGGGLRLQQVYEKERRFFMERWRPLIRDDPYFHPGLSLYAADERLP